VFLVIYPNFFEGVFADVSRSI